MNSSEKPLMKLHNKMNLIHLLISKYHTNIGHWSTSSDALTYFDCLPQQHTKKDQFVLTFIKYFFIFSIMKNFYQDFKVGTTLQYYDYSGTIIDNAIKEFLNTAYTSVYPSVIIHPYIFALVALFLYTLK